MQPLNSQETEIIQYSAKGCTAKEIAKMIGLEHRTIEIYLSTIRKKLNARNIAHAIYIASQKNILG